jgi:hypothetical protein
LHFSDDLCPAEHLLDTIRVRVCIGPQNEAMFEPTHPSSQKRTRFGFDLVFHSWNRSSKLELDHRHLLFHQAFVLLEHLEA